MKITAKSRYALTVLLDIHYFQQLEPAVTIRSIAERNSLSKSLVEQVIVKMRKLELVISKRGNKGGYTLGKNAANIALDRVIASAEEKTDFTNCQGDINCAGGSICMTHFVWEGLSKCIQNYLHSLTLADIIADINNRDIFSEKIPKNNQIQAHII